MKLFCYGILKRGYELDLTNYACKFLGEAILPKAILYGIGRFAEEYGGKRGYSGVGLRFTEDPNRVAHGEIFEIPDHLWHWLDGIENNGFSYTRKIVQALLQDDHDAAVLPVDCYVYEHTFPGMKYVNEIEGGVF